MYKQIELFRGTQDFITDRIGAIEAEKFFQGAEYVIAIGSNDFINNYLMPVYSDSWTYTNESFIQYLMNMLGDQITV